MALAALSVASRRNHRLVSCSGCGEAVDALAHGGEAEVGAVRDQGGEQRPGQIGVARLIPAERLEGAG